MVKPTMQRGAKLATVANASGNSPVFGVSAAPPSRGDHVSLISRASAAFALTTGSALASKVINIGLQIVLARLLDPAEFALIALAYTVTGLVSLIQQMGMREVLIQRQRHFERWATAALWLSLVTGLAAAGLTALIAPLAARFYHSPGLVGILLVLAASIPIQNLSLVPEARLSGRLRFGALTVYSLFSTLFTAALTVLFAWQGFGAYSFVLPRLIEGATRTGFMWSAAHPKIRPKFYFRRWRLLIGDSSLAAAANFFFLLVTQGDNILLGVLAPARVLGVYYVAFGISMQGTILLVGNLFDVLFPSLVSVAGGPTQQANSLLRTLRALCSVSIPLCFCQAALARPLIHLFYGPKWYGAIPIMQVLSVGMSVHVIGWPAHAMMQAQGRFRENFLMSLWMSALLAGLVFVAIVPARHLFSYSVWNDAGFRTAVGAVVAYAIMQPMYLYNSIRPAGKGVRDILSITVRPVLASGVCVALGVGANVLVLTRVRTCEFFQIAIIVGVSGVLYVVVAWRVLPGFRDVANLARKMMSRF